MCVNMLKHLTLGFAFDFQLVLWVDVLNIEPINENMYNKMVKRTWLHSNRLGAPAGTQGGFPPIFNHLHMVL